MTLPIRAVFFDLDGTLIHSAPDLHVAANVIARARGWEAFDLATITSFIGNGVPKLVERIFLANGADPQGQDFDDAISDFLTYYNAHATDMTAPYEGIVEVLLWLVKENISAGVITNKPETSARIILRDLGLEKYFEVIVGGDTTQNTKPDPLPYLTACQKIGVAVSDTIYVGDSETDAATAVNANVPFVLYSGGYRSTAVYEIPHNVVVDHPDEIPAALTMPNLLRAKKA